MATKASLIADAKQRMHTSLETVRRELAAMRTGRASLSMLDGVRVDYYGNPTPLNQMASLSTPDPTLITVQPWDPKVLPLVEKAIRTSDLDLNPQNDGKIIRILTCAHRGPAQNLVKHAQNTPRKDGSRCATARVSTT
jgi:ribosome recycling factor